MEIGSFNFPRNVNKAEWDELARGVLGDEFTQYINENLGKNPDLFDRKIDEAFREFKAVKVDDDHGKDYDFDDDKMKLRWVDLLIFQIALEAQVQASIREVILTAITKTPLKTEIDTHNLVTVLDALYSETFPEADKQRA